MKNFHPSNQRRSFCQNEALFCSGKGNSVRTRTASSPILSISSQGMVSVSSAPAARTDAACPAKAGSEPARSVGQVPDHRPCPGRPHWIAARPLWRKAPGMSSAPLPAVCSLLLYAAGRRLMQTGPLCYTGCSDQLENSPIQIEVCVDV